MQCRRGHDHAINNVCCEGKTGGGTSERKEEQGDEDIDSTADKGGGGVKQADGKIKKVKNKDQDGQNEDS